MSLQGLTEPLTGEILKYLFSIKDPGDSTEFCPSSERGMTLPRSSDEDEDWLDYSCTWNIPSKAGGRRKGASSSEDVLPIAMPREELPAPAILGGGQKWQGQASHRYPVSLCPACLMVRDRPEGRMSLRRRMHLKHSSDLQDPKDELIQNDLDRFLWLWPKPFMVDNAVDL